MSNQQNTRQKSPGIGTAILKFAGTLVGLAVVMGRKVGFCLRNIMAVKSGLLIRTVKKPAQITTVNNTIDFDEKNTVMQQAKKTVRVRAKKKSIGRKKPSASKAAVKSKTPKAKRAAGPQNRSTSKANTKTDITIKAQDGSFQHA